MLFLSVKVKYHVNLPQETDPTVKAVVTFKNAF